MKRSYLLLLVILLSHNKLFAQFPKDTLKVGYTQAAPFIIPAEDGLEGISVYLWEEIAKDLDQPFRYVQLPFKDLLRALEDGSIDLSINPLTITSERSRKIGFTHSFYASNTTVAANEASPLHRFFNFLTSFFNINFLSAFLALVFIICLFAWLLWHFEKKVNQEHFRPGIEGLWDGIWWSVVTMTTVGYGDKAPKSRGGKIVALVWMFSGLLFISGFTASIASTLTVNQLAANIKNISDFKDRPVGCIKNSSTATYLKRHFFKKVELYDNVMAGLEELQAHEIDAFLYDEPIVKYRIKETPSLHHLEVLPIKFNLQFYAFGIPKSKPALKETISQKILEFTEKAEWALVLSEYGLTEL